MKRIDWDGLKVEWLAGSETLNAFRLRKKISSTGHFYRVVEENGWEAARERIRKTAAQRTEGRLVTETVKNWDQYRRLMADCRARAEKILKRTQKGDEDLTPLELQQLVASIEKLLKSESFLDGGPSERVENPATATPTHAQVVELLRMMREGDPRVVHPEAMTDEERSG